jgi:outer membrane protein assembly factor BamB
VSWNITNESASAISFSGPIVSRDNKTLAFSFGDNLTFATAYSVEIATGQIAWNYSLSEYLPMGIGISHDDQVVYYAQVGSLIAFQKVSGGVIWANSVDFNGSFRSVQGISDDLVIATESGDCCVGSRIVAINPKTGERLWDKDFYGGWKGYSGGYGATIDVNRNLYIGLSQFGVVSLTSKGNVLFNRSFVDSSWAVSYSFQPLLARNSIGLFFVVFWAGDTVPDQVRQNFITSFKYGMEIASV